MKIAKQIACFLKKHSFLFAVLFFVLLAQAILDLATNRPINILGMVGYSVLMIGFALNMD